MEKRRAPFSLTEATGTSSVAYAVTVERFFAFLVTLNSGWQKTLSFLVNLRIVRRRSPNR